MKKYSTESSKKLTETLKHLQGSRVENIEAMTKLSWNKLNDLHKYYYDWAEGAKHEGQNESCAINTEKWMQVNEAINVKSGNEEEAWNSLS